MKKVWIKGKWRWEFLKYALIILMYLMVAPFLVHAVELLEVAYADETTMKPYLFIAGGTFGNTAMVVHIAAGIALTVLVPLQLVGVIRWHITAMHRVTGMILIGLGLLTSVGGLAFIAIRGTIGGPVMSIGFSLYGVCMFTAAIRTLQMARDSNRTKHGQWAIRFFWLAMGSWFYRLHYVLWYLLTGGAWSNPDFSGTFDKIQNFAFFLPYLVIVEIWIYHQHSNRVRLRSTQVQ